MKISFIDLYAGIGGFRVALEHLGAECIGFSEIDKTAINVYKKNFDTSKEIEIGDITTASNIPYCDILTGGVPCQSWSIAGKMKGFDDPRGRLWLDTIKVTEKVKPRAFIYENVKGLSDPRNKANLDLIRSEFDKINYNTYPKVLNAFDYGLPQSRERLFLVGIRKDIDKKDFVFPEKNKHLPFLADILENRPKMDKVVTNLETYKNGFNMASIVNKGNFYIFSDVRNGNHTIHSWDLIETSQKEKDICLAILKNRRKSIYGTQDGNPMSFEHISALKNGLTLDSLKNKDDEVTLEDVEGLVEKKILRKVGEKYEFVNSKISAGINNIYRIFLPESHVFSTLTKTGTKDFVSEIAIPLNIDNKKEYFIEEIFKKKKYRQLSLKEGTRLQGFPDNFEFGDNYAKSMGLLGNAVAVNVVEAVSANLIKSIF